MKVVVPTFYQEKALVGAFYVITNLRMELFEALHVTLRDTGQMCWVYQSPDTVLYIFPLNFVCPITDNSGSHSWQYMAHTDNETCRNKTRLNFSSNSIHNLLQPCYVLLNLPWRRLAWFWFFWHGPRIAECWTSRTNWTSPGTRTRSENILVTF